ncbi:MAG: UvrABC system protein B [Candidatus Giovannonibacteria bacterium GW2011_GWA2_53_7]|uniref:UvrABC system protein B n=1 Tax=Candidatus Giovannonibacteria bacterium GW2011_GWA2_53_7 TaxID=1618650 RepID=A0A0G1XTJ1_9BACT|nr:MAG: UvrABC system protein B [Candidatus Giovannonibacteria bacterium GW2011_GWA2_53_7]
MNFQLVSNYQPAGDQPSAISALTKGLHDGLNKQTLFGVTGSGKTFTIANVIQNIQRPTLVLAHNKTLAAQLCNEFREFFPNNVVEYFVSYYDYYQPEAYLPRTDTYIEKDAQINEEIDRLRHAATQALLSRRDVIIVASVSCIYGLGSPEAYKEFVIHIEQGSTRTEVMRQLVAMQFERTNADLKLGTYRVRGDVMEVMPMSEETVYRITFVGETTDEIVQMDPITRKRIREQEDLWIFPAKHFMSTPVTRERAVKAIREELTLRLAELDREGKVLEAERLSRRTRYDLEMIQNVGTCSGIENYSRHFDGRVSGEPPFTLLDYFPEDFLLVVDESHVTLPQVRGMYNGDQARKKTLVEHGFRLPSAVDNRPLTFDEFDKKMTSSIFVSATPGLIEKEASQQIVEQIIRPTGLVDPEVIVRPVTEKGAYPGQIDDLISEIEKRIPKKERVLVTTLTKRMAEDLTDFLAERGVKVQYLHSDVKTIDRIGVLTDLRKGVYDVVVGVNLLREGLDLPEVTLMGILDADKEGFLRSESSLIQTIGRVARNVEGKVILYGDEVTGSMKRAIDETNRRRKKQIAYNKKHGITPKTIIKEVGDIRVLLGLGEGDVKNILKIEMTASSKELEEVIAEKKAEMKKSAANLQFELAGILRDEIKILEKELLSKT